VDFFNISFERNRMTTVPNKKGLLKLGLIPDWLDLLFLKSVTPIIEFFSKRGIDPNWITVSSFLLNIIAAFFIYDGQFVAAGLIIGTAGILDFVDGKVAAALKRITKFGGILDSILDRYSDMVIFGSIAVYFVQHGFLLIAVVALLALIGAAMTSYVRAVGSLHGFRFRVGAVRRQERISLICFALLFGSLDSYLQYLLVNVMGLFSTTVLLPPLLLSIVIFLLAILTNVTAIQRIVVLARFSREADIQNSKLT
jgi:CDP-diacylglycerol--glycerol-3-phosphate 3-phosphatidyltransferase